MASILTTFANNITPILTHSRRMLGLILLTMHTQFLVVHKSCQAHPSQDFCPQRLFQKSDPGHAIIKDRFQLFDRSAMKWYHSHFFRYSSPILNFMALAK